MLEDPRSGRRMDDAHDRAGAAVLLGQPHQRHRRPRQADGPLPGGPALPRLARTAPNSRRRASRRARRTARPPSTSSASEVEPDADRLSHPGTPRARRDANQARGDVLGRGDRGHRRVRDRVLRRRVRRTLRARSLGAYGRVPKTKTPTARMRPASMGRERAALLARAHRGGRGTSSGPEPKGTC